MVLQRTQQRPADPVNYRPTLVKPISHDEAVVVWHSGRNALDIAPAKPKNVNVSRFGSRELSEKKRHVWTQDARNPKLVACESQTRLVAHEQSEVRMTFENVPGANKGLEGIEMDGLRQLNDRVI